ncbi:family 43 glycosylhydrolase [Paenibacillus thermotolerans]|uniref:family 43 glycosylhydrolase n=1 Tax=Paenibacillus thermotolerans TaxID=3027807 RepID=UPI0023677A13|nr:MULTISPECIES: family 43 glycosylhydrolase [unclassified Paenibacillus]
MKKSMAVAAGLAGAALMIAIAAIFVADRGGSGNAPEAQPEPVLYTNPVFEPVLADPSVIRGEDGLFYAFGTEDDWGDGEGSRLIPILKSPDLISWEVSGEAFESKPEWKDSGGLWAPHIAYFNDKYYLYYSMSEWGDPNPGIGVAVADKPAGPFEDKGKLFTSDEIGVRNSIDPMLFVDNGTPYLFWGSFHGIYGIELAKDGLSITGEKFRIAGSDYEAPYIIKRDGYYYFFGSLGSCCEGENSTYRVAVARSDNIKGPYTDQQGDDIVYSQGKPVVVGMFMTGEEKEFVGPGHNSIVRDDNGTDWLVYHAVDVSYPKLGNGATRRPLMIDPLEWNDGWPALKDLRPSTKEQPGPYFK